MLAAQNKSQALPASMAHQAMGGGDCVTFTGSPSSSVIETNGHGTPGKNLALRKKKTLSNCNCQMEDYDG